MLAEEPYSTLCTACIEGKVAAVIGGPNCRTWSIRRHIPKPGGGTPVRGRLWPSCWGLDNLEPQAQSKVDGDNTLLRRQMVLMRLAYFYEQRTCLFLEHPEDPDICSRIPAAKHCSSIWLYQKLHNLYTPLTSTFTPSTNAEWDKLSPRPPRSLQTYL